MPLLLFIVWIVLEVVLSAAIADAIGGGFVLLWMLGSVALGIIVIRRSGWQAIQRIQIALARNEVPARDLLNAVLLFGAGALLIVPGPISDSVGLLLLLPFMRAPALNAADSGVRRARPDLHEPIIIEGEFSDVPPSRQTIDHSDER